MLDKEIVSVTNRRLKFSIFWQWAIGFFFNLFLNFTVSFKYCNSLLEFCATSLASWTGTTFFLNIRFYWFSFQSSYICLEIILVFRTNLSVNDKNICTFVSTFPCTYIFLEDFMIVRRWDRGPVVTTKNSTKPQNT